MNLTLFKLRKQLKRDKSGMGSLVGVILGGVLLSTIVASGTSWYLSMRNNLGNTEDKLEAQTIAQSEWERLSHMSLDELEANRNTFKTPYSAGTGSQFSISVNLGEKGTFNGGTCGNVSGGYANCFKNTTITVYRDGNRLFTTRTLPLMAGDYTRKEIDDKLAALKNDYTNKINDEATARANKDTDLQNQINGVKKSLQDEYYKKTEVDKKLNESGGMTYTPANGHVYTNCKILGIHGSNWHGGTGGDFSSGTSTMMTVRCTFTRTGATYTQDLQISDVGF